jgi:serine protease Do
MIAGSAPGTKIELGYLRGGKPGTARVEIGEQPKLEGEEVETGVGFHVKEITPNLARTHRLTSTSGAFVTFVANGSPASEAGLRSGDVIVRIEASRRREPRAVSAARWRASIRSTASSSRHGAATT